MDASDITAERLVKAFRECMDVDDSDQIMKRIDVSGTIIHHEEVKKHVRSLMMTMVPLMTVSPSTHFKVLLLMGINIGMNMAQQIEDLKVLETLS